MRISDREVWTAANLIVKRYGADAGGVAGENQALRHDDRPQRGFQAVRLGRRPKAIQSAKPAHQLSFSDRNQAGLIRVHGIQNVSGIGAD